MKSFIIFTFFLSSFVSSSSWSKTDTICIQELLFDLTSDVSDLRRVPTTSAIRYDLSDTPFARFQNQFQEAQDRALNSQITVPTRSDFSESARLQIRTVEAQMQELARRGPAIQERVIAINNSLSRYIEGIDETSYIQALTTRVSNLQNEVPVIRVRTRPPVASRELNIREFSTMNELESNFDVLARKAAAPTEEGSSVIHEVDSAFIAQGISQNYLAISQTGDLAIRSSTLGEKVFSVGHEGALNFQGVLSNTQGRRYYGLIFDRGFVSQNGADLRGYSGAAQNNPNAQIFNERHSADGRVFTIRAENATREQGQVHIQNRGGYTRMEINGEVISQMDWMNRQVRGIVEFDVNGNILRIIEVEH